MEDLFSKPMTGYTILLVIFSGVGCLGRYLISSAKTRDTFIMDTLLKLMQSTDKGVQDTQKEVSGIRRDVIGLEESVESTQTANLLILSKISDQVANTEITRMHRRVSDMRECQGEYKEEWQETNRQLRRYDEATLKIISVIEAIGAERRKTIKRRKGDV